MSHLTTDLLIEALHDGVVREDVSAVTVPVVGERALCRGSLKR
jgi:hypothetical protein